jgi:hypothetical protein
MNETIDLLINQGSDWNYVFFDQNDPVDPNNPTNPANAVNLTGCSATFTAATYFGSPVNVFQLSTAAGSLVINAAAGSVAASIPASQTSTFTASGLPAPLQIGGAVFQMAVYTLKIINAAGGIVRECSGKLYLSLDV